jgi:hypothetical protein
MLYFLDIVSIQQPDHSACAADLKRLRVFHAHRENAQKLVAAQSWIAAVTALKEALADVSEVPVYVTEFSISLCECYSKGLLYHCVLYYCNHFLIIV